MPTMPLTTRQAFVAMVQSAGAFICVCGREMRRYFQIVNRGYRTKNNQWVGIPPEKPRRRR